MSSNLIIPPLHSQPTGWLRATVIPDYALIPDSMSPLGGKRRKRMLETGMLLELLGIIPLMGILLIIGQGKKNIIKLIGLGVTLANLLVYIVLFIYKDNEGGEIGVDSISIIMIGVTVIIMPLTMLKEEGRKGYVIIMIVIE